jgi:hypothetical protein
MADDIQLDEPAADSPQAYKPKKAAPPWMVFAVVLSFACLLSALVLQFMEHQYFRGGTPSPGDPYKGPALIP